MKRYYFLSLLLILWLMPTAIFSIFYSKYGADSEVLIDHSALMLSYSVTIISFLIILRINRKIKKINVFLFCPLIWFFFIFFSYLLMILGLISWGRIPNFDILKVYLFQYQALLSAINLPVWLVLLFVLFFLVILFIYTKIVEKIFIKALEDINKKTIFSSISWFALVVGLAFSAKFSLYEFIWKGESREPWRQLFAASVNRSGDSVLLEVLGKYADPRISEKEELMKKSYKANKVKKARSVILITVDALRPDRMGIYGAKRQTTPYLQRMKEKGLAHVIYEARSSCSESTCGLLSLLSGKEPQQLLSKNFGLPEILSKLNYKNYFILSGDHSNYYGLKESYGKNDLYWDGTHNSSGYVNDDFAVLEQVQKMPLAKEDENYFLFIHMMSVHGLGKRHSQFERWLPQKSIYGVPVELGDRKREYENYYDNGILQADFLIEKIYSSLNQKGYIDERSIVLITADHGESLGEHNIRAHAESLYESVIRIPWVWLGRPLGKEQHPVVQADFAPTVLKEIGAPIPEHWRGVPLQDGTLHRKYTFHAQAPFAGVVKYSTHSREL